MDRKASWQDAQSDCQSKQANLITVNDPNEQTFLNGLLGERGSWLGLNNQENLNVLEWVSGEQSSYTNWAPNEPSIDINKRCAKIQRTLGHKWQMLSCGLKYRYTCEKGLSSVKIERFRSEYEYEIEYEYNF